MIFFLDNSIDYNNSNNRLYEIICLITIQLALTKLLQSFDLLKDNNSIIIGHSSGEIVSSYIAGIIDFRTTCCIIYSLARAGQDYQGSMLATNYSKSQAITVINEYLIYSNSIKNNEENINNNDNILSIACINSPYSTTLSGSTYSINNFLYYITNKYKSEIEVKNNYF